MIGRKIAGGIRYCVNAKGLKFESARVLYDALLLSVLMYGDETMIWEEESRIRAVQKDNLRGALYIRRMDKVPNAQIRELCGVTKGVEERIDEVFFDGSAMWR